jgi:hypothetical protein
LFAQEVKGALADKLRRKVTSAAARIPDPGLRATMEAEWLGELGAAKDRPLTAVFLVRGYDKAARRIAADLALAPAPDQGPSFFYRLQHASAAHSKALAAAVRRVEPTLRRLGARPFFVLGFTIAGLIASSLHVAPPLVMGLTGLLAGLASGVAAAYSWSQRKQIRSAK